MSWIDQSQKDFIITTGDGKEYKPYWKGPAKSQDFNVSEFEFPNVSGTLVKRGQPRGIRHTLNLFFQGENHLSQTKSFEISARDKRPWIISHPYYGRLTVQPTSITIDNRTENVSLLVIEVIETITEENPKFELSAPEEIESRKADLDSDLGSTISTEIVPVSEDVNNLTELNETIYNKNKLDILDSIDAENYFNLFNTAQGKILNATNDVFSAINTLQEVINYPSLFVQTIKSRIETLKDQFDTLLKVFDPNTSLSRNSKKLLECTGSTMISAMALASITNAEYDSRTDVVDTINDILIKYNEFTENLDNLQTDNNGEEESFIPNAENSIALNNLMTYTVSQLFEVAINSRQERKIFLEQDSNLILLTHRFIGLKPDDSTLLEFININEIGLNEYLQIKKGREITYYV